MENTELSSVNPPKPGSRRARRAAERARHEAVTGEIPAVVVVPDLVEAGAPVVVPPAVPFAEKMNHELVLSRVETEAPVRNSRKSTMMQGVGLSSAAALVVGIGLGIAVENVPQNLAMATGGPSLTDIATASLTLGERTPVIEGVTTKFTLTADGKQKPLVSSSRVTLADALAAAGIKLNETDIVSHPLDKPIAANAHVKITRVTSESVSEPYTVEPEVKREDDPTLAKGEEKKVAEGKPGQGNRTVTITKHDGKEVSRTVAVEAITTPAEPTVVKVGTKEKSSLVPVNAAPVAPGTSRSIAAQMVAARGWSEAEFTCLDQLWQRESGWNHLAANPSGAYGIPQSLPGSKMASAGADWQTNPATQIKWGLGYISGRYGTPCGALSHSHSVGWY